MPLPAVIVQSLAEHCAPSVAARTLVSIAQVESGFDPLAIGVNGPIPARIHSHTREEAESIATRLLERGANVDLGLGQINSSNLARLKLSIAGAFQPCRNLSAAGQLLKEAYARQAPRLGQEQAALRRALSVYNTGRTDRGFSNGYVAKVSAAAGVPATAYAPQAPAALPPAATWDVFGRTPAHLVFTATNPGDTP